MRKMTIAYRVKVSGKTVLLTQDPARAIERAKQHKNKCESVRLTQERDGQPYRLIGV